MHNFKKVRAVLLVLLLVLGINWLMTLMLYPYTFARVDVHNLKSNAYDDIFVGSSHGKSGINPLVVDEVTGRKSTNLCLGGQYPVDSYFLVKEAVRRQPVKRVIYEVDPGYWIGEIGENVSFGQTYYELPFSLVKAEYFKDKIMGRDLRNTLFPWYLFRNEYPRILKNMKLKFSEEYKTYGTDSFDKGGQRYLPEGFIYRDPIPKEHKTEENMVLWDEELLNQDSLKYLKKMKELCDKEGISLLVIITPVPEVTKEKYSEEFSAAYEFVDKAVKELGISYINFNFEKGIDDRLEAFGDYDGHMQGEAANAFSRILGGYLKKQSES